MPWQDEEHSAALVRRYRANPQTLFESVALHAACVRLRVEASLPTPIRPVYVPETQSAPRSFEVQRPKAREPDWLPKYTNQPLWGRA